MLSRCLVLSGGSVVKNLPANKGDVGLIPGSGISPGEASSSCGHKRGRHGLPTKQHEWWCLLPYGIKKVKVFPTNSSFKQMEFIESWMNSLDEFA